MVAVSLLGLPGASLAQRAAVRGSVAGPGGATVEYATVTLHRAADSVAVKAELSDAKGRFQVEAAAGKTYRVSVMQVGYGRYWSPAFTLPATGQDLPAIQLAASAKSTLGPVTVTGQRPLYEHLADRTVVHVADSPLSAGATTLEVLGRAPGVSLDAADNLSLRGRQGLLVLIDGKRSPLSGADLADYLRTLPADQLQTIELVTNPPASYDAQGGAGVIDIKLKKDQRLGTNGSVNASYGRSEDGKFTAGLSLNHRRKNLNVYGNYTFTNRRYFQRFNFEREFFPAPTIVTPGRSRQANDQVSHQVAHAGKVGLDFTVSKRTLLGASVTALVSEVDNVADNLTDLYDSSKLFDTYCSTTAQDISRPSGSANLNLRHAFADSATAAVLTADVDYARYHTTRLLSLYTFGHTLPQPDRLLSGDQRSNLSIGAAKVDFSQPLPHRLRLDVGAKVTQVVSNSDVAFSSTTYSTPGSQPVPRPDISGAFSFHENVNAAYASLRGARPKTTFQVGLRAEHTNTLAEDKGPNPLTVPRNYLQLFPSALVERTLSERHALALTLARRIDRPSYFEVNPLRVYLDATSYRRGNPYLQPATTYTAGLTHKYRQNLSTTLAYARTDLPFTVAVQPAEGSLLVKNQNENLETQHFYSLTFAAPLTVAKWWTLYTENTFYYNRYVGYLNSTDLDRGRVACNLSVNNSFTLPGGWLAELNGLYESREQAGFQDTRDRGQVAVALQKSLWHKQGTFRLSATDIFYTTPIRATSTYSNFVESRYERFDLRIVTASLAYRFGNSKVAGARKRLAGADEELKRGIEK